MAGAGYNHVCRIWRFVESGNDDDIGGSVPSGTVAYDGVSMRIKSDRAERVLLQQGIEAAPTFSAMVVPATMNILNNDQLEITLPVTSKLYGKKFRIVGVEEVSPHPSVPGNFILLSLIRWDKSINNALE